MDPTERLCCSPSLLYQHMQTLWRLFTGLATVKVMLNLDLQKCYVVESMIRSHFWNRESDSLPRCMIALD